MSDYLYGQAFNVGDVATGYTTRKQRRALGEVGATYDPTAGFDEESAGAKYLKEKGLFDEGIDMSSRKNRRLLRRAQRMDNRQARRDEYLSQVLGRTYRYGKPQVATQTELTWRPPVPTRLPIPEYNFGIWSK